MRSIFSLSLISNVAYRPNLWSSRPLPSQAAAIGASFSVVAGPTTPANHFFRNAMRFAATTHVFAEAKAKTRSHGRTRSISNAALAKLLTKYNGDRDIVASLPSVPISKSTITWRILNADLDDPLAVFRWGKPRRPKWDDEVLEASLHLKKGHRGQAARILGYHPRTIQRRVMHSGQESSLEPYKKINGRGRKPSLSDEALAHLFEIAEGDIDWVLRHVKIRRRQVFRRLLSAGKQSPLYPYRALAKRS